MIRTHRIRLHPTAVQAVYFAKAAGTARFVYNWALEQWTKQYQEYKAGTRDKAPNALDLKKQFNAIKREQYPWVYEVTKCAAEQAFTDLGTAFTNFFEGRAEYPQFKAKKRSRASFYLDNTKFKVGHHWIKMPHIGKVNMAESLRFKGKVLAARIVRVADWWFVSITVELPDRTVLAHPGGAIGVDLGINHLMTLSDGSVLENQKPLRNHQKKLKRLQRSLSRKQKDSKNREKARQKLAREHYRITCIRDDILHKATTALTREYAFIAIETLNVEGMMQNHCLAQALADVALGRFKALLLHKAQSTGTIVVQVDQFFPSSKRCSQCGVIKDDLTLADRIYECPACGLALDRDHNAAINILTEGLRLRSAA